MFKKLLDGELSLKDTFWKFGVVGLVFVNMLVRIFGSVTVVLGTWRSSAQYDRSLWLRHLSRFLILVMVFYSVRSLF